MTGVHGGTAIKLDGSNINPVALTLLNFKLSDGGFLIPTPQTVDPTKQTRQSHLRRRAFQFSRILAISTTISSRLMLSSSFGRKVRSRPTSSWQTMIRPSRFQVTASILRATSLVFQVPAIPSTQCSLSPIHPLSATHCSTKHELGMCARTPARRL